MKKRIVSLILSLIIVLAALVSVWADSPTDEILNYEITADVREDAYVDFVYHIEWQVLDTVKYGPLSWVSVGIPNTNVNYKALSNNIDHIEYSSSGGSYLNIYFNTEYFGGETASFDFSVRCSHIFTVNGENEGYTTYYFTPGWFDEIAVDRLLIRWNADKLESWSEGCLIKDGYCCWEKSLEPGESFSVELSYPNDAFDFSAYQNNVQKTSGQKNSNDDFWIMAVIISIIFFGGFFVLVYKLIKSTKKSYEEASGFGSATESKVTRTKVEYYPVCQGCGAAREKGQEECPYCGRSFIKSEEILEEKDLKDKDKEAMKYDTNGEYAYGSDPNTFVRVHVVPIPVARPVIHNDVPPRRPGRGPGGGGFGGGCAHSSCACACVSCACACACAGGGRAGCSSKDFYNTDLKLSMLEKQLKR